MTAPRGPELRTERLILRRWNDADRDAFAAINADPAVMEHFPALLDRGQSDDFVDRIEATFDGRGYGLWAVEIPGRAAFAGFIGLWPALFAAPFTPAVEVGWRLGVEHWGQGYAPEGAAAALDHGFAVAQLDEIVSMTTVANTKSRRVMEKLGMHRDPADDFDHPNTPGWHGRRHVLYRLSAAEWSQYRSPS